MRVDVFSPRVLPYLLTLGFLGAGALVGLVVATGKLVLIALVIGGLTGLLLLNALPVAVWILMIGVFLINGPVGYFLPGLSKIAWLFSLLGVFMSGAALLHAAVGRESPTRPIPTFVHLALVFAIFAAATALLSNGSMAEISAGAKRQFQFWGVVFLFAVVPFSSATVRRWLLFLLGVALVQLPFALYQRVVLVPQVMGFEAPGFIPFDIVVGSFEGSMFGGGASSIMAMYLVIAAVSVFCAYRERLIGPGWFVALLVATVFPLGLGETKVVLLLIPVVLFFAFYDTVAKRPLAFIGSSLLMMVIIGFLAYLYFMVQVSGTANWRDSLDATFAYNFGEKGYYGSGVNRLTAIPYWFQSQSWADPVGALFGHGVGSSYGVDGRAPLMGHMFVAHSGMHIDLVTTSLMLWDFGFVGTLLFFAVLTSAAVSAARCLSSAVTPWDRTLCRVLLAGVGASFLMMFYSASIVVLVSHSFILSLNLGFIAWRARHGPLAPFPGEALPQPARGGAARRQPGRRGAGKFPLPDAPFTPGPMIGAVAGAHPTTRFADQPAPFSADRNRQTQHKTSPRRDDARPPEAGFSPSRREGAQRPGSVSEPGARPPEAGFSPSRRDGAQRPGSVSDPGAPPPARPDRSGRIEPVIDSGPFTRS